MPAYDHERFNPPAPVAMVTICHPEDGAVEAEVSMLIDTGADVTLLPAAILSSLGIVGTGESYQLVAFDGTISEAQAVRADLLFVKKRFSGSISPD
jgi:hypothetical protein